MITFYHSKAELADVPELGKYFSKIHLIYLPKWMSYWQSFRVLFSKTPFQVGYFRSKAMAKRIEKLHQQESYDAVHVQHLRMSPYWAAIKDVPRILDLPDAYSLYWKRRVSAFTGWKKIFARIEQQRVYHYEKILASYNLALVCSKEDAAYLEQEHQLKNVAVLPNGVDTDTFSQEKHSYEIEKTILFTGNMDYAPNVDAAQYFVAEILPEIKKEVKDAVFIIAGQRPVKKVRELASEAVLVTGFVPQLSDLYRKASIVVAPLRFGAGTQNKVLEAMSMGVPVVSREVGFAGLNIPSGKGVILARDTATFTTECIRLLKDKDLRETTGRAGQKVIQQQFSWNSVAAQLERYFKTIITSSSKN